MPCRCLIEQTGEADFARLLQEYILSIPAEEAASDEVYQARLSACLDCEWLADGMCRLCGCYVQLRAKKRRMACPNTPQKWGKAQ